jgi:hypothetical protein
LYYVYQSLFVFSKVSLGNFLNQKSGQQIFL